MKPLLALAFAVIAGACARDSSDPSPVAKPPAPSPVAADAALPAPPQPAPPQPAPAIDVPSPLAATAMTGPFASLEAWCTAIASRSRTSDDRHECYSDEEHLALLVSGPSSAPAVAPWSAGRLVVTRDLDFHGNLAVQTDTGWYVLERVVGYGSDRSKSTIEVRNLELAVRDVIAGGAAEVVFRHALDVEEVEAAQLEPDDIHTSSHHETLVLCGLGASQRPSCLPPIPLREIHREGTQVTDVPLAMTVHGEVIEHTAWTHRIVFP